MWSRDQSFVTHTSIFDLSWSKMDLFPIRVVLSNFVDQELSGVETLEINFFFNLIRSRKNKFFRFNIFFEFEFSIFFFFVRKYQRISMEVCTKPMNGR